MCRAWAWVAPHVPARHDPPINVPQRAVPCLVYLSMGWAVPCRAGPLGQVSQNPENLGWRGPAEPDRAPRGPFPSRSHLLHTAKPLSIASLYLSPARHAADAASRAFSLLRRATCRLPRLQLAPPSSSARLPPGRGPCAPGVLAGPRRPWMPRRPATPRRVAAPSASPGLPARSGQLRKFRIGNKCYGNNNFLLGLTVVFSSYT